MVASTPRVGVVVLNWNGWRDTVECLDSLQAACPGPARTVLVENGSTDDSLARFQEWGRGKGEPGRVELLVSPANLGFAGGNNLGLRHLGEDPSLSHFLLLNNDATVAPDYFVELTHALEAVPHAGLLSGTIYYSARRDKVWYAGGRIVSWRGTVSHGERVPEETGPRPTEFVSGCAMVISRAALDLLGPLPTCYQPIYWEDAEYSFRAGRAGLGVVYAPRLRAYHKVTASANTPDLTSRFTYAYHKNRGLFVRRNVRPALRWAALCYLAAVRIGAGLSLIGRGRPRAAAAVIRGTLAGLLAPLRREGLP